MDVSAATPASIDGHDGLYLEFTTGSIDYAKCNGGSFAFFEADPGTAHVEIPGILERWWVIDVDGTPVIVGSAAAPMATEQSTSLGETRPASRIRTRTLQVRARRGTGGHCRFPVSPSRDPGAIRTPVEERRARDFS